MQMLHFLFYCIQQVLASFVHVKCKHSPSQICIFEIGVRIVFGGRGRHEILGKCDICTYEPNGMIT
jgi:hypothetical protein